ncbi:hypothetical protein BCR33DRAFT_752011 [Rhizoclosmatium globosum]|uniref:Uncharacterized protein n=1 Tax=Rhizoclosmatium globosum TaxID=329046 RepID=A0A1Y1ZQI1_9FUNG|nr:hypothetical protein BCR33DRAFT_752011 [Rhizoclosmatium globosum]|eukprot:ORY12486.1 hypothetical protein BCR33DRAFT_752011 [Rhizoclosmatium globosum]
MELCIQLRGKASKPTSQGEIGKQPKPFNSISSRIFASINSILFQSVQNKSSHLFNCIVSETQLQLPLQSPCPQTKKQRRQANAWKNKLCIDPTNGDHTNQVEVNKVAHQDSGDLLLPDSQNKRGSSPTDKPDPKRSLHYQITEPTEPDGNSLNNEYSSETDLDITEMPASNIQPTGRLNTFDDGDNNNEDLMPSYPEATLIKDHDFPQVKIRGVEMLVPVSLQGYQLPYYLCGPLFHGLKSSPNGGPGFRKSFLTEKSSLQHTDLVSNSC